MIKRTLATGVTVLWVSCLFAQTPPPAKKAASQRPARRAAASAQRFAIDYVQTNQTKNDWEEINFEFNSAILSDGFPTLLWLADFLKSHPEYKVKIVGHTDYVGSNAYNNELAMARAESVASFLRKYGAGANQLSTAGEGKRMPEVDNRTKEGRFVNRRTMLTVTDGQGRSMSLEDLIRSTIPKVAERPAGGMGDCCADILKRLDDLAGLIRGLKDNEDSEHNKLRGEIADLRNQINGMPKPLTRQQTQDIVKTEGDNAANRAMEELTRRNRKFSLLGLNIGPTYDEGRTGDFTFSGRGQFFSPFGGSGTHAVQAQAEYMYYPGRQEGQFDLGLVNRWGNIQAGLFGSFKYLNFRQYQNGGGLGQGSFVMDWLFSRGKIGIFGSKGFKNVAVLNRQTLAPGTFLETYARIVDQVGVSTQVGLWGDSYLEGNVGYLKRHGPGSDRPGFTARLVQPVSSEFALTAEIGLNETFLNTTNSGRVVFGFQFGNFMRPKEYLQTKSPVPMDIPRIRYELLTRRVGATPPVADAGPDQIGVRPGTITLNGSGSYDPVGLPLTYKWVQIAGPPVSIANSNAAVATFTAAESLIYRFRLTVTNTENLSSSASTTVTTIAIPDINIIRFTATPMSITRGGSSLLEWNVTNAESISISPEVGSGLRAQGTFTVHPTTEPTTTYTLTATNTTNGKQATAQVVITVNAPGPSDPRIIRFEAVPTNIMPGESSMLSWTTEGASTVTIDNGVGDVSASGSKAVSPTKTTTYTLTAKGFDGRTVTASQVVTVSTGTARILEFSVTPTIIDVGGSAQLCWNVENATEVSIAPGIGKVDPKACATVSPAATTTYTLTAINATSTVTASATLLVGQVRILTFTNDPPYSGKAGDPVTLSWTTSGATSVTVTGPFLSGAGPLPVNGSVVINPNTNADYTLIAYGPNGESVSAVLHVFVR